MKIIYDFQEDFKNFAAGEFVGHEKGLIGKRVSSVPEVFVEDVEDVKTLHISNRETKDSGIFIRLRMFQGVLPGDRLTVTGRMSEYTPMGKEWAIALISTRDSKSTQITHPSNIFSLSRILEESDFAQTFAVHTIGWGAEEPLMDFYVDGILISRKDMSEIEIDPRKVVYSMTADPDLEAATLPDTNNFEEPERLVRPSGNPTVRILKRGGKNILHIGNRFRDFDAMDLLVSRMDLLVGNRYRITIRGKPDGDVPEGSTLMLQGLPGYTWQSNTVILRDTEFILQHTLSQTEVDKWTTVRITSNTPGASISFYIYEMEIERL